MTLSKRVGPKGRVIAFEPGAAPYACLERNCANLMPNVTPVNAGVGSEPSEAAYAPCGNAGASRLVDGPGIKIVALDSFDLLRPVKFIKIDVEGWELEVLRGVKKLITEDRPDMVIEINRGTLAARGTSWEAIRDELIKHGYHWKITDPHLTEDSAQYDVYVSKATPIPDIMPWRLVG